MNQMFDFLPVRLDLSISQGTTLNRAVWNARTGSGAVVDLTNANGVCYITTSPMLWQNATPTMYTVGVSTDLNGTITLVANSGVMLTIPSGNFSYNVLLTDPSDNTVMKALYGVIQIEPAVLAGMPPLVVDAESNTTPIINE